MDLNSAARRKNATRENTNTLKAWLYEHRKNPYPTKGEKIMLAIITKMTLTQVSTWFANARRRLKKENKMTWSPKNKADDDDDDDDDDKADHDNEDNGNGSDGDFRDKDRDTDSVIGLGEESEDEIIDAGKFTHFIVNQRSPAFLWRHYHPQAAVPLDCIFCQFQCVPLSNFYTIKRYVN